MKSTHNLKNQKQIEEVLKEMVEEAFEQIKDEPILLCMECCDVDLFVAASYHEEFQDAIKINFELDQFGEILDQEKYNELMKELDQYYVELHISSGLFDYFPSGIYEIDGEERESETDMLAPKGFFFAPFDDARFKK